MNYFAITQAAADWLLTNSGHLGDFRRTMRSISELRDLDRSVLVTGTVRATASAQAGMVCFWNTDYLSSSGIENWGIFRIAHPLGIFDFPEIFDEVVERCLYVANQRLQGLLIDDRMYPRSWDDIHTCLSGRGTEARQFSIGWSEATMSIQSSSVRGALIVGPNHDREHLVTASENERKNLNKLVGEANALLQSASRRPATELAKAPFLRDCFRTRAAPSISEPHPVAEVPLLSSPITDIEANRTSTLTFNEWSVTDSPLSPAQRTIFESDVLLKQPVRIIGAAGSGKSLLMQLLAMKRLRVAEGDKKSLRVLYVVHNTAMMNSIWSRFVTLGAEKYLDGTVDQQLYVKTLFEHSQLEAGIENTALIDTDASQTKLYQLEWIEKFLNEVLEDLKPNNVDCPLLHQLLKRRELRHLFSELLAIEFGVAIKGHGLSENPKRYVGSEQPFSRLHRLLKPKEREFVFTVFQKYQHEISEVSGVLDSDDVALTLLGQLRTPLWNLKRRKLGYDFVFVDETQLFNENERRLFSLLTRSDGQYVPIALALDEAQELRGTVSAGFGLLGIQSIADASLDVVHRSTKSILALAFHVIQQTTDLFGPDFPDFTAQSVTVVPDDHRLAGAPTLVTLGSETPNFAKAIVRHARQLRKQNLRQVCVVIHAEKYWSEVHAAFAKEDKSGDDVLVLERRGEKIDASRPVVVLARPENVGGQEFDAVILVGLEQGLVPPRFEGHSGLATALEQQALRETYLAITRARFRLLVILPHGAVVSKILQGAVAKGLLVPEGKIKSS